MLFLKGLGALLGACVALMATTTPGAAERIDRGTQVIDGTRVNSTVYHERGYAVFENDCGSQRLSQSALQGGAKPTNIIPCPRPSARTEPQHVPSTRRSGERLWSAVAAGTDRSGDRARVSAGLGENYETKADAEQAALASCQKNISSCKVVAAWNVGCYYITVSEQAENVAWGSGPTAQDAYNECYKRVEGGNCKTKGLGSCQPR